MRFGFPIFPHTRSLLRLCVGAQGVNGGNDERVLEYRVVIYACNLSPWEMEGRGSGVQSQPPLYRELQANLGYPRPLSRQGGGETKKEPPASLVNVALWWERGMKTTITGVLKEMQR